MEGNFGGWKHLANDHKFAKVSSTKILCSILKKFKFAKIYFANCAFVANSPEFTPTKVSLYTVSDDYVHWQCGAPFLASFGRLQDHRIEVCVCVCVRTCVRVC